MSITTKLLGSASLASIGLSAGLLVYHENAEERYNAFLEETSQMVPVVRTISMLQTALDDLYDAEKALMSYRPGRSHHAPNVDEAIEELEAARATLSVEDVSLSYEFRALDELVRIIQRELGRTERGQSESFYEPQRNQINELQERTEQAVEQYQRQIPDTVVERQAALQSQRSFGYFPYAPILLFWLGAISGMAYFGFKALEQEQKKAK